MKAEFSDSLMLESPAGEKELALLNATKINDVRQVTTFLPALGEALDLVCTGSTPERWNFDALFCGVLVYRLTIKKTAEELRMEGVAR